jgi:hypothetical protein
MDWLIALLTWLSADPAVMDQAAPKAAAAVEVAYASIPRIELPAGKAKTPCPTGNCPAKK